MACLVLSTPTKQYTIELESFNSIGRHPLNTIQLLDKVISKEHCVLERRNHQFILRDLGSLNGTFVNGKRITEEHLLQHGDQITLGTIQARYEDHPPSHPTHTKDHSPIPSSPPSLDQNEGDTASAFSPTHRTSLLSQTRVDMLNSTGGIIGAQIASSCQCFLPFEQIQHDPTQLRLDYERLRISWELTRDISRERNLDPLLERILEALFKFVKAERGVILLQDKEGILQPRAAKRRDGLDTPIQISSTILSHVIEQKASLFTHNALSDFSAGNANSMIINCISSALVTPLIHENKVLGALWLDSPALAQFEPKDLEIISSMASQAAMFIENNILSQQIEHEIITRDRFARLLSPNVAEQVVSGKLEIKKGGEAIDQCTVFNSDIRGFTHMSEGTPANVILDILNEYFEQMVEIIFKYEGTLDKFMGDGILAFWGAPVAHPDDAERAVLCALEQMEFLKRFNAKRTLAHQCPLEIGISIHTGPLVAGYIGSSKALSYTIIGDTVNTCARLCSLAAGGEIIITEQTLARIGDQFEVEALPLVALKGKEHLSQSFRIKGKKENNT
ncbi:adenylate/guanylate cyclase domain-containing protein [Pajaroellobacter abortibovis]|uniref:Adenylate cyclase n=1 Tax=Pajaroellobacter abortibovis TaxID=1882918 RepID=A0A1L6MZI0_9BACT|nr:adenylate/guanylate cyclase domain-containing protein [Pajaroellobacter abortibovis]APS00909.1 hypothetical protein BCY86_05580 [Pajaroellobacter abortibovis]